MYIETVSNLFGQLLNVCDCCMWGSRRMVRSGPHMLTVFPNSVCLMHHRLACKNIGSGHMKSAGNRLNIYRLYIYMGSL